MRWLPQDTGSSGVFGRATVARPPFAPASADLRLAWWPELLAGCGLTGSCFTPYPASSHPVAGLWAKILTAADPVRCLPTASAPISPANLRPRPNRLWLISPANPLTQLPSQVTRQPPPPPTFHSRLTAFSSSHPSQQSFSCCFVILPQIKPHIKPLTPPITRLRASKVTFDAKTTPQAQPSSNKRSIAIRVHGPCYMALPLKLALLQLLQPTAHYLA